MTSNATARLETIMVTLPTVTDHHAPGCPLYSLLKRVTREAVEEIFSDQSVAPKAFPPFGDVVFPHHRLGSGDSLDLFDLDEMILFSFYWTHRDQYTRVLDAGANIGLHTIVLSRCGYEIRAYEPDPAHTAILRRNLALNGVDAVQPVEAAISDEAGTMEFVRVVGHTTSSHLAGAKPHPYGELLRFPVRVDSFAPLLAWADLVKMDVEGQEKEILLATDRNQWRGRDALVEVGSADNGAALYDHFKDLGIRLFSQKTGWHEVRSLDDMPFSYREGSLFVSGRDYHPWSPTQALFT